ncbi:phage tail fiber protein [Hyphomonas sp. NPDC076900]|uniref:phage tail fiber domain-containing protein n=1 Tax=Hyphomonas sp. NPDC076900 TaxID=3390570 RepID=UPI003D08325B
MPLSSVTRVSDGIQKQYDFDFGYLRKSHVFVFVNNELRSFKWLGPFQIELLNFPQPDDTVTIRRLTDRVNRITTFTDGQTILAEDLNAADLQTFYIAQEMLDQIEERILAGEVSVVGAGYITAQWIQEQLAANIAGSTQFQAISDALDNEALERANALAAEALARAADIAAEAAARGDAVFALEQADLEAGQRLDVLEAEVDDPDTGIKARIGTLETVAVDLENNKADASVVSAIQAAVDAAEAQITTIDEALATETAARTSQIAAASSRLDGAEASLTTLGVTVTNLATSKAGAYGPGPAEGR